MPSNTFLPVHKMAGKATVHLDSDTDHYGLQVNRVMCFSMDRPLQSHYQRMAEVFLDCRLPGEERTWLNDPFDNNLQRQSEGVRAEWNAALAALNTKPGPAMSELLLAPCSRSVHKPCFMAAVIKLIVACPLSKIRLYNIAAYCILNQDIAIM